MKATRAVWLLSALATVLLSIGAAQVSSGTPQSEDSHSVTVTFFVEDKLRNPVSSLQPSELSVHDNGKPPLRIVSLDSAKGLPLRLGILINTNPYPKGWEAYSPQSRPQWYASIVKAAVDFVNQMLTGPDDRAFIATYATIRAGMTFVGPGQGVHIDLGQFLKADGPDFIGFHDAISVACAKVFATDPTARERRILIVLPGSSVQIGQDLADHSQAVSAALHAGVKVFVLSNDFMRLPHSGIMNADTDDIDRGRIAAETGGSYLLAGDLRQGSVTLLPLSHYFESAKSQIDAMYSLTYIPAEPYQSGQFRRFELKVPTNKNWIAHAPKEYSSVSAQ